MTVTLSPDRSHKLRSAYLAPRSKNRSTVCELCQVVGQVVAAFTAVLWGPLYYRHKHRLKSAKLRKYQGGFEPLIGLTQETKIELEWRINNIAHLFFPLEETEP